MTRFGAESYILGLHCISPVSVHVCIEAEKPREKNPKRYNCIGLVRGVNFEIVLFFTNFQSGSSTALDKNKTSSYATGRNCRHVDFAF